jgi:antitoxin component HigA of HigAB toxin-antitoxin module
MAEVADWRGWEDLRRALTSADPVGRLTVFNLGGDAYRLVARVEYEKHRVYARRVMTHRSTTLVRELCEERGIPQRALVPIFGAPSIVSEVLAGKRELQRKHIEGLAQFFQVPPGAFFAAGREDKRPA